MHKSVKSHHFPEESWCERVCLSEVNSSLAQK
jgi:hypothetical protein